MGVEWRLNDGDRVNIPKLHAFEGDRSSCSMVTRRTTVAVDGVEDLERCRVCVTVLEARRRRATA